MVPESLDVSLSKMQNSDYSNVQKSINPRIHGIKPRLEQKQDIPTSEFENISITMPKAPIIKMR